MAWENSENHKIRPLTVFRPFLLVSIKQFMNCPNPLKTVKTRYIRYLFDKTNTTTEKIDFLIHCSDVIYKITCITQLETILAFSD